MGVMVPEGLERRESMQNRRGRRMGMSLSQPSPPPPLNLVIKRDNVTRTLRCGAPRAAGMLALNAPGR